MFPSHDRGGLGEKPPTKDYTLIKYKGKYYLSSEAGKYITALAGSRLNALKGNSLNEQEDTQLALPEPPKQTANFLGDDNMDYEGGMAKSQMLKMKNYAKALCDMIDDETQLEAWVQAKLTKASDYMSSVYHYLDYQRTKNVNEAFELNGREVVDLEADGGGSIDPFIGAAYYLDTGEALTDNEIEALVDKYPADLEPAGS